MKPIDVDDRFDVNTKEDRKVSRLVEGLWIIGLSKGAYVFLGSEAEVDAVFGPGFISLIETVALDVHFRLHLPKSLRMNVFYGEESSVNKEDVQAIHYFANTSQLFLSDVIARGGALRPQDSPSNTRIRKVAASWWRNTRLIWEMRSKMSRTIHVKAN